MYIDLEYYQDLYGEIDPFVFEENCYEAQTRLDNATTSILGVRRLEEFFPTDEADAERVKRCLAKLTNTLVKAQETRDKLFKDGAISSVNSGSESISYNPQLVASEVSEQQLNREIRNIIKDYLSGVTDVNGISLLYGGN